MNEAQVADDIGVVQLLDDLRFCRQPANIGALISSGQENLERQKGPDIFAVVIRLTRHIADTSPAHRQHLVDPVIAIKDVAGIEDGTPPILRSCPSAREVAARLRVPRKGRQAAAAVMLAFVGHQLTATPYRGFQSQTGFAYARLIFPG